MQRPLVWVGIAYVTGEVWAAAEFSPILGWLLILAGIILTGRYKRQILRNWTFYILPVFLMSGFVSFSRGMTFPCEAMLSEGKAETAFYGTVTACEEKEKSVLVTLTARIKSCESGVSCAETGILIYLDKAEERPEPGDVMEGTGQLEKPESASNPGQFDAAGYYHAKGIDYILWPEKAVIRFRSISYRLCLERLRRRWINIYRQCLPEADSGIISAILLGNKTMLDENTENLYRRAGIIHILAISGLHISIIGMGIFKLLRRVGIGLRGAACTAAFLVLSYGVMTGMGPSTERAVIMFLVRMGAVYLGRSYDMLSALSLSALIIFIRRPMMMTQPGVQFSYAAVLSIGVLWPAMSRVLSLDRKKNWGRLLAKIGPSAAVTIGTLPLMAYYYGEIPLLSFFLNLVVLPLMDLLVPVGLGAGIAGFAVPAVAGFLGGGIHFILMFMNRLCELAALFPAAVWKTGVPPLVSVLFCYGIMLLFVLLSAVTVRKTRRLLFLLVLCGLILIPVRRMTPMVAFLDVGQGDCIFIRSPSGSTWLVDGGSSDVDQVGKYRMIPFLDYYGEDGVDYVCVTHGDEDHLSGVRELLEADKIAHLVLSEASKTDEGCLELAALAGKHQTTVIYIEEGDSWRDGGWQFECLWPAAEAAGDKNDTSVVLKLHAGETSFLLTGDISETVEEKLDIEGVSGTGILKVAHHGSGYSSSEAFLKKTGAQLAIVSCGENNRYGHPAEETLNRLKEAGMDIYLTMRDGAVLLPYHNGSFHITTWRSNKSYTNTIIQYINTYTTKNRMLK